MTDDTLLLRQVNPAWIQAGRITSQVFRPTPKDSKCLSVYDGDQISAEDAWHHYCKNPRVSSIGVMAVTVSECDKQDLPVTPDPAPFPEHVVIEFDGYSNSQIKTKAKLLTQVSEARGWQYRTEEN